MDIWVLRYPHYDAHIGVKLFTALASAVAAIGFVLVVPRALALPSLADLRTALEAARAGHFTDAQRLRATYEHAFVGIAEVDQEGRYLRVNEHFCSITGYRADELLGRPFHDMAHPEDRASCLERFHQQMRGELPAYSYEKRCIRKDGTLAWIELEASVVNDERGAPLYGIRILRDITERKQGEERQQIMMHELNHRVRNTLAIVQSISSQTLKAAAVDRGVAAALTDRLVALAGAHTILSGEQGAGADLGSVVTQAVSAHERIRAEGPPVPLRPALVVMLSLALHELATNAAKYGALSNATGWVDLTWRLAGDRLSLSWREQGGPPAAPPGRTGFGSRLIERLVRAEAGAVLSTRYERTGAEVDIDVPAKLAA
jgi:PAS domain S-box-containing protein